MKAIHKLIILNRLKIIPKPLCVRILICSNFVKYFNKACNEQIIWMLDFILKFSYRCSKLQIDDVFTKSAEEGKLDLVKCFIENKASVTAHNNYAIKFACNEGHYEVVKYLIENKADVNAGLGMPLRCACGTGNIDIIRELLDNGADLHDIYYLIEILETCGHTHVIEYLLSR